MAEAGSGGLRARANVWLERDGRVVISGFRARLLEAVAREGSVARAAASLDLPYRTAWKKLDEMEGAAGEALVERGAGGAGGGGSELTAAGSRLLAEYRALAGPVLEALHRGEAALTPPGAAASPPGTPDAGDTPA